MKIFLQQGNYVLAISGGVDSMVLLDLIVKQYAGIVDYNFVVAHFDHGIRTDSKLDRLLVQKISNKNKLDFFYEEANLPQNTSEEIARKARYQFLENIKQKTNSDCIVTAHHQDDLIETVIFNLIRGTGRKGLSPLMNQPGLSRPMLHYTKQQICRYGSRRRLVWREDSTNLNLDYSRNYIRHKIRPLFNQNQIDWLVDLIFYQGKLNLEIDQLLLSLLDKNDYYKIDKNYLNSLPISLASEFIASWLRKNNLRNFDKKAILRIYRSSKVLQNGKKINVNGNFFVVIERDCLRLVDLKG